MAHSSKPGTKRLRPVLKTGNNHTVHSKGILLDAKGLSRLMSVQKAQSRQNQEPKPQRSEE